MSDLTLLQKAQNETVKQSLDALEQDAPQMQADAQLDGSFEGEASLPITSGPKLLRGGRFTVYVKGKVQVLKDAVAGFRISKKF